MYTLTLPRHMHNASNSFVWELNFVYFFSGGFFGSHSHIHKRRQLTVFCSDRTICKSKMSVDGQWSTFASKTVNFMGESLWSHHFRVDSSEPMQAPQPICGKILRFGCCCCLLWIYIFISFGRTVKSWWNECTNMYLQCASHFRVCSRNQYSNIAELYERRHTRIYIFGHRRFAMHRFVYTYTYIVFVYSPPSVSLCSVADAVIVVDVCRRPFAHLSLCCLCIE